VTKTQSGRPAAILTNRRTILKAGAAAALFGGAPSVLRAQTPTVKIGLLFPMTGAFAYNGDQSRKGAMLAIDEINAAGGIKSLGGAKLEGVVADTQSRPEVSVSEVDNLAAQGVPIMIGAYSSGLSLTATQAAVRHNIPFIVDCGSADQITQRGYKNVFRLSPSFSRAASRSVENLVKLNDAAGKPVKTVMLVHEDGPFGSSLAKFMSEALPKEGFEIVAVAPHPNGARDFTNIALKMRSAKPDLIVPSNYLNEYILLVRTVMQQKIQTKGIYSVYGAGASNIKFVREQNDAAQYLMDCSHWYDPRKPRTQSFLKKCADQKIDVTYEVMLDYSSVLLAASALEAAGSTKNDAVIAALEASTFSDHIMPYGPTKFVNGQNAGAQPVNTQVQGKAIEVIFPKEFASAQPVFPVPARS
jgi:branched-chain amino acid transport system substrate-binding protein